MAFNINTIVGITVGGLMIGYVGVIGIQAMTTANLTGTVGTVVTTVLPIMAAVGFLYTLIPRNR